MLSIIKEVEKKEIIPPLGIDIFILYV